MDLNEMASREEPREALKRPEAETFQERFETPDEQFETPEEEPREALNRPEAETFRERFETPDERFKTPEEEPREALKPFKAFPNRERMPQERMPLLEAVMEYRKQDPAYFCIPGHRFERGVNPAWREIVGDRIFDFDVTETPLTDDLHNAEGAILEAEKLAGQVFGSEETHFLINGTTCGNQVMVISTAFAGQKIALPRNAHKSALMGLIISGARPVYIMPEILEDSGLHGGITSRAVERMFQEHPDCKGVLVVSPTYYGLCSDLEAIAKVCHGHGAVLLVDEAHGAHCYFSGQLPKGALEQGADMCSQSIHKVAGSLTQSSMLHIKSRLVDRDRVRANLHLVQSTSPSYVLMTSLDAARQDLALHGEEMAARALELARYARERISRIDGIACIGREVVGKAGVAELDETRLAFSGEKLGLTGFELKEILFNEYGCDLELADYKNALAIVTFGNTKEDMDRLISALDGTAKRYAAAAGDIGRKEGKPLLSLPRLPGQPEYALSPRDAYFAEKERIPWEQAAGRLAGEMIAPYPPGIPVIYPGERMSREVWLFLDKYKREKRHFHGPSDGELSTLLVIKKE